MLLLKSEKRSSVLDFFSELFASPKDLSFSEIIENNIFSAVQLEELAFLCNMSVSTFKRTFKKHYPSSPATYIRKKRIDRAQHLLQTTDLQIQEIGYQCGFNELSSFSHTFQKVTGASPSEYRLNQINK
jgi:transcriptional regulator GlxA family with amidase domain